MIVLPLFHLSTKKSFKFNFEAYQAHVLIAGIVLSICFKDVFIMQSSEPTFSSAVFHSLSSIQVLFYQVPSFETNILLIQECTGFFIRIIPYYQAPNFLQKSPIYQQWPTPPLIFHLTRLLLLNKYQACERHGQHPPRIIAMISTRSNILRANPACKTPYIVINASIAPGQTVKRIGSFDEQWKTLYKNNNSHIMKHITVIIIPQSFMACHYELFQLIHQKKHQTIKISLNIIKVLIFCEIIINATFLTVVIFFNMNYFYQQKSQQQLIPQQSQMKECKNCHTCQRQSYNLLSATCGHKICFHCVKSNRYSHKCSACAGNQPKNKSFLSPSRNVSHEHKERSTKVKDSESKVNSQYSPHTIMKSRPSIHRSSIGNPDQVQQPLHSLAPTIACKQHQQPLSMYCKTAKELICSVCLCNRSKYGDVMPIRSAQEQLRKQNKLNKEECKIILGNIDNAHKIINKNQQMFRNTMNNSLASIESFFNEIRREAQTLQKKAKEEISSFFDSKINECHDIQTDLQYLSQILREFRENNKENCNFTELLYLFSSFKVIKHTIKNLDLDYLPYSKQPQVLELSKVGIKDMFRGIIKLRLDLPLKLGDRRKVKSQSNKSASRSKHQQWEEVHRGGYTGKMGKEHSGSIVKKHQMSLCNNVHGIQINEEERNLYKMLLKTKFKL